MIICEQLRAFNEIDIGLLEREAELMRAREEAQREKEAAIEAGLSSTHWLTGPRVNLLAKRRLRPRPLTRERWEHIHRLWELYQERFRALGAHSGLRTFWEVHKDWGDSMRREGRLKPRNPWSGLA
jgi:hypothetical protein